ncbi:coatomer complex protein [Lenzites betulinus]|nr:coatomer complex protein [Lenzites betulinus]
MDSPDLYHVKQQFTLGAYKSVVELALPDPNSPDYTPTLVYQARAHLALGNTAAALALAPPESDSIALKAVAALAQYLSAEADADAALEQLRDLVVEIEGEEDEDEEAPAEWEKGVVRVLAGAAFARAGEVEEALETLGAGTDTRNIEAIAYTTQIYLSIARPDLARKELARAARWAEDDLLLQLAECAVGLAAGRDAYSDAAAFLTEQLANPSLSSPRLLTARGVARLLRGEVAGARSDLEEAQSVGAGGDAETAAALVVVAGLAGKGVEAEELYGKLAAEHPSFPLVTDLQRKAAQFDELAAKFTVPPLATVSA